VAIVGYSGSRKTTLVSLVKGPKIGARRAVHRDGEPHPCPRSREELLDNPEYYRMRERLIGFLDARRHVHPSAEPKSTGKSANGSRRDPVGAPG
jgi:ABC-type lipoprotein export system ATPase subunit